jgi:hypothetical protein
MSTLFGMMIINMGIQDVAVSSIKAGLLFSINEELRKPPHT